MALAETVTHMHKALAETVTQMRKAPASILCGALQEEKYLWTSWGGNAYGITGRSFGVGFSFKFLLPSAAAHTCLPSAGEVGSRKAPINNFPFHCCYGAPGTIHKPGEEQMPAFSAPEYSHMLCSCGLDFEPSNGWHCCLLWFRIYVHA